MEQHKPTARYSFIYNNLVNGTEDFVGLVAYSIYKQEKIKYIQEFEKENKRSPKTEELFDFHRQSQWRIEQFKQLATYRVNKFLDDIYKTSSEDKEKEYNKKILKAKMSGWAASITQSVIGSILGSIAIGALIISLLYSRYGLEWIVKDAIHTYQSTSSSLVEQKK